MFDIQPSPRQAFEDRMLAEGSPLYDAMGLLSQLASGRGACMCLEHPDHGITVIADDAWTHDSTDTMHRRDRHSVFSLKGHEGFDTISVLVGAATEDELDLMMGDCAIAAAALDLVASVSIAKALTGGAAPMIAA